jgi:hypothetical protein
MLSLLALVFVLAAWAVVAVGERRVSELDLSAWGTDLDIPERLAIDRYVARHFRPYIGAAIALEGLAAAALYAAGRRGPLGWLGVAVGVVWLHSAAWHSLQLLVRLVFAAGGVRF